MFEQLFHLLQRGLVMPDEVDAFVGLMLAALPELWPVYEVILRECEDLDMADGAPGELLWQHVTGLTERLAPDDDETAQGELESLLRLLEEEYGKSYVIHQLIDDRVLPMLVPDKSHPDLTRLLGPKLAAALRKKQSWRARPSHEALVNRLVSAVPALEELAEENTYGDHGGVLVHIFLGEVVHREVDNLIHGQLGEVRTVLDVLEAEFAGEAEEPIAVSFVENLPYPQEPGAEIVTFLGPRLRAVLDRQRPSLEAAWPGSR